MKNKIKEFSKGNFQAACPEVVFPETHIMMVVGEGEVYKGSFIIQNQRGGDIRGIVYPSSFRISCMEQGFEGNPVKMNFTYDSTGMQPGQVEQGKFTIVCDGGEYELAFTAMIEKPFIMTSYGKIQNIDDFKKLAAQDFEEARRLFRSRQFYDVLKYEDVRVKNLYAHMRKWALDEQALEEFLVGVKRKEKIFLTLSDEDIEFTDVLESKKDWIEITKNTWGYAPIHIWADNDFIHVGQNDITTEDFVGNNYRLEYVILKQHLHAGRNYGKLYIETPYETLTVEVEVLQHVMHSETHGLKEMLAGQALKEYLAYISGKAETGTWVEKTIEKVKQLRELEPENDLYLLMQAHVYLIGGREEEARWILENYNYYRFMIGRKPEVSAYYLFLMSLIRKEAAYTSRTLEELHRLYLKYPKSWMILYMILHLDPQYKNQNERFRALENHFFGGANQILFYAEAYLCLSQKVILLRKLGSFEIQLLNFAVKYKIMSKELALYAADFICHQKRYDKKLYRILGNMYKMYEEPEILQAICTQLIKGNRIGSDYFMWYEKAVQYELKIAQLYEYYMMSVNEQRVKGAFPRSIYLYFRHGNHLDYKKAALLYANILTYEDENSELYKHYSEEIETFAWKQLLKRHINDSLRIIYNRFLTEREMTPERLDALYDICHAYRVTTKRKGMKYVLVIGKEGDVLQRAAYTKEGTQIYLYHKEVRIIWEGNNGIHYADSISYDTRRLFYEKHFLKMCKNRMTDKEEQEKSSSQIPVTFENLKLYGLRMFDEQEVFLLCSKRVREEYKEDDFLIYLSFELMKKGYYDKALLTYLTRYYCGATYDMKLLWKKAKEYEVQTHSLSERIITQMLFSERMFREEEIFADYYSGKMYFRIKQAYLAYISREFIVRDRVVDGKIFELIVQEYMKKEELADICKAAVLKYYAEKAFDEELAETLHGFLAELCEKRMIFAFYLNYPEKWLREVQLYDKVILEYHAALESRVKIVYQINQGDMESLDYRTESLLPMYENIFAKEFILYKDEKLKYYFKETGKEKTVAGNKKVCQQKRAISADGKYGRLNTMLELSGKEKQEAMVQYRQEEAAAKQIFVAY